MLKQFGITCAVVLGALGVCAGGVMAQIDPQPDGLGVYFDLEGNVTHWVTTQPMEWVTAYLLATNLSSPSGMSAYVVWHHVEGAPCGFMEHGFCDFLGDPCHNCELHALPSPVIVLVEYGLLVASPQTEVRFYLGPGCWGSPFPPSYATEADPLDIRPFQVSSGSFDLPVATINCAPPVPAREPTWGTVKALFR